MQVKKQQLEPDMKQQTGSKLRKEYVEAFLSHCLFNLHAEYIMWNAGLDDSQAGIKIARRNINNFRYVDNTTLRAEIKEDLKSLLMKVKEETEKTGLNLNIQKNNIMAFGPIAAATAAKTLQSYPTLCDPIDGSPLGSAVLGILQARTLKWVVISFYNAWRWKGKVKSLSRVWLFTTPWTVAYQASPSMGFSRQGSWSGVPLPSMSGPITSWQIDGETMGTMTDFILGGSKITSVDDCSYEIKRCLLPERKVMAKLDRTLTSRDITLPTKVHLVKAMVFPVVMYWC